MDALEINYQPDGNRKSRKAFTLWEKVFKPMPDDWQSERERARERN
jgi:hypothetical protein